MWTMLAFSALMVLGPASLDAAAPHASVAVAAVSHCCKKSGGGRVRGGGSSRSPSVRAPRARSYSAPRSRSTRPRASRPPSARKRAGKAPRASASGTRDSRGRLKRNPQAKRDFLRQSGHPSGWRGHVVDHVVPLACGGTDSPSNMQWQTTAEAKAKDRVERKGCGRRK